MGACIAHHAKCFEGEMSSRSGLHRDLRPQAAGARHLARPLARRDKRVKRVKWMKPEVAGSVSSLGGPASEVVRGNLRRRPASASRQSRPVGVTSPPEREMLLHVLSGSFGGQYLATRSRPTDGFGPSASLVDRQGSAKQCCAAASREEPLADRRRENGTFIPLSPNGRSGFARQRSLRNVRCVIPGWFYASI